MKQDCLLVQVLTLTNKCFAIGAVVLDYEWLELLASQQYGDGFPVVCRPSQIGFVQHNASLLSTVPFDGLATTA
ncbi:hypothetical protein PC128_g7312 [Phytophthora cactorum]|nr:hypothetical protein PC128_g7312 [Phytophthora cactorum]